MRSFIGERLYYEIAMSIGNSLDLTAMLRESLSTYLRKLNCLAGAVLRCEDGDAECRCETVYAIPKRMQKNSFLKRALDEVRGRLSEGGYAKCLSVIPSVEAVGDKSYYLMTLPGFGLLLLVKSAPGFSEADLKSLAPLNAKLANSCHSCDVNRRLQIEIKEREKAERMYRAIVDNALDGIYQSTLDGGYIHVNPAIARIFGYTSADEMIRMVNDVGAMHYVYPEDRQRFIEILLEKGQVGGFEFEFRKTDGSTGWISTSARLEVDDDGKPLYIEGTSKDITHQKHAEAALMEAKAEAERLSQMKTNLITMVSHELRTPLTSILGFAKIIRKRLDEVQGLDLSLEGAAESKLSKVGDNVGVIITEGERLTELINNVLDLAKLEAGHYEWNIETVFMKDVLKHSLLSTEVLFRGTPVALVKEVPDDLPAVESDHDRLVQVTINLISNAAKFTPEGEVRVTAAEEDGFIVVRVADSGIGVPQEEADVIFETFRQLGNTLTDKPKGTGLGLPICREIVEHLGGKIWLESREEGGSVFAYSVPVR